MGRRVGTDRRDRRRTELRHISREDEDNMIDEREGISDTKLLIVSDVLEIFSDVL